MELLFYNIFNGLNNVNYRIGNRVESLEKKSFRIFVF